MLFFYINSASKITLFLLGALTATYSLPLFKYNSKTIRLRDFSYLKILLIAFTWAIVCGNLVLFNSHISFSINKHFFIFIEKFLFLIAITIPFDIRDYEQDKIEAVKTIPNTIGIKQSILLALVCLLTSLFLILFFNTNIYYKLAYVLVYIYAGTLIAIANSKKNAMFFLFYLDAALIILGALVFIAYLITS